MNDVNDSFDLDGFKPSEYTLWVDYRMEKTTLLRMTYGSMWTTQALAGQTVTTPSGPQTMPGYKERINYLTADVSYVYWQGFYTGGIFGGIGGYSVNPQPVAARVRRVPGHGPEGVRLERSESMESSASPRISPSSCASRTTTCWRTSIGTS